MNIQKLMMRQLSNKTVRVVAPTHNELNGDEFVVHSEQAIVDSYPPTVKTVFTEDQLSKLKELSGRAKRDYVRTIK
jgi:hypothetical protein